MNTLTRYVVVTGGHHHVTDNEPREIPVEVAVLGTEKRGRAEYERALDEALPVDDGCRLVELHAVEVEVRDENFAPGMLRLLLEVDYGLPYILQTADWATLRRVTVSGAGSVTADALAEREGAEA